MKLEIEIIRKAEFTQTTRGKWVKIPTKIPAMVSINGINVFSEEPRNKDHADFINRRLVVKKENSEEEFNESSENNDSNSNSNNNVKKDDEDNEDNEDKKDPIGFGHF